MKHLLYNFMVFHFFLNNIPYLVTYLTTNSRQNNNRFYTNIWHLKHYLHISKRRSNNFKVCYFIKVFWQEKISFTKTKQYWKIWKVHGIILKFIHWKLWRVQTNCWDLLWLANILSKWAIPLEIEHEIHFLK